MSKHEQVNLDSCIKCSICVSECPVARVTDKYPGPKRMGPDLERFKLEDEAAVHAALGYCTNCKTCDTVCPSGVNVSTMITKSKADYARRQGVKLRDNTLAHVEVIGKLSLTVPALVNIAGKIKPFRALGEAVTGISRDMPFPAYAKKNFYEQFKTIKQPSGKRKVVYFPGCNVTYNAPDVGLAVVKVLNKNHTEVIVEEFNCCGLPLIANGILTEAEKYARRNAEKLNQYLAKGYKIITSCPSCNLTLNKEYEELFDIRIGDSSHERIMDVFEYLLELAENDELNTDFLPIEERKGYHEPCHLKAAAIGKPSLEILHLIPKLKIHNLDAGCCGHSGTYGYKKEKYPISMEIGHNIADAVQDAGVDEVLSECGMCQLQINHVSKVKVAHPVQILAQAYGILGKTP